MEDDLEGGMIEGLGPHGRPQRFYVVAVSRTPKHHLTDGQNSGQSPDALHDVPLPRKSVEKLFEDIGINLPKILSEHMQFEQWPAHWKTAATETFEKIDGMDRLNSRGNGEGAFRWDVRRQRLEEQQENVLPPIQSLSKGKAIARLRTMWEFFRKMDPDLRMMLINQGELSEDGFASLSDENFSPWPHTFSTEKIEGGLVLRPVEEETKEGHSAEFKAECAYAGAEKKVHRNIQNWTSFWTGNEHVDAERYALGLGPTLAHQASILPTETRKSALFPEEYSVTNIVDISDFQQQSQHLDGHILEGITKMLDDYGMEIVDLRGGDKDKLQKCFVSFGFSDAMIHAISDKNSSVYSAGNDLIDNRAFAGAFALMHGEDIEGAIWMQTWEESRESKSVFVKANTVEEAKLSSSPYYGGDAENLDQAIKNSLYIRACGTANASYRKWLPFLQVWGVVKMASHPYAGIIARIPSDGSGPSMSYMTEINEFLGIQRAFSFMGDRTKVREELKKLGTSKSSREDKNLSNFDFTKKGPWEIRKVSFVSATAEKVALESAKRAGIATGQSWKTAEISSYFGARIYPTAEQLFGLYVLLHMTDEMLEGGSDTESVSLTEIEQSVNFR